MQRSLPALSVLLFAMAACSPGDQPETVYNINPVAPRDLSDEIRREIESVNREAFDALIAGEIEPLMATYTTDAAMVMAPFTEAHGEEAIRAFWQKSIEDEDFNRATLEPVGEISIEAWKGGAAWRGRIQLMQPDGVGVTFDAEYAFVKDESGWRREREEWRFDAPRAAAPEPAVNDTATTLTTG